MSVFPDREMYSGEGREYTDEESIEELTRDLTSIKAEKLLDDVIKTLTYDPDGIYLGQVGKVKFRVRRGPNNRFRTTPEQQ